MKLRVSGRSMFAAMLLLLFAGVSSLPVSAQKKPNVIVILVTM